MALTKYKIGDLIEQVDERNSEGLYTLEDVKGISTEKSFIETKANLMGVSLDSYKVVHSKEFAYVSDTSRRGDKIALAYNDTEKGVLISSIYTTFKVTRPDLLLSDYLFMYFNRPEFDRYSRFNSWGSARETFDWSDFCDIPLFLPSLSTQRRYVDVYLSMQDNLQQYQSRLSDLKLTCDAYIENLRRTLPSTPIGAYIEEVNVRNTDLKNTNVQGVESSSNFTETKANTAGLDFSNYKIVKPHQFAYNPSRINIGSIALRYDTDCIISPMYTVFAVSDSNKLLPEYLIMWLTRSEFLRSTLFYAIGSVRDTFDFEDMCNVSIPIPSLSIQREIVDIYACYLERQRIASELKSTLSRLCPLLIRGSLLDS